MKNRICGMLMMLGAAIGGCAADHQADKAPATCRVHQVPLQGGTAVIVYGFLADPLAEQREREFPCAWSWVPDGCIVGAETTREVLYCPICREVEAAAVAERASQPKQLGTEGQGHGQ